MDVEVEHVRSVGLGHGRSIISFVEKLSCPFFLQVESEEEPEGMEEIKFDTPNEEVSFLILCGGNDDNVEELTDELFSD